MKIENFLKEVLEPIQSKYKVDAKEARSIVDSYVRFESLMMMKEPPNIDEEVQFLTDDFADISTTTFDNPPDYPEKVKPKRNTNIGKKYVRKTDLVKGSYKPNQKAQKEIDLVYTYIAAKGEISHYKLVTNSVLKGPKVASRIAEIVQGLIDIGRVKVTRDGGNQQQRFYSIVKE